jgi:NitT/TauT family transport system permease protein
MEAAAMFLIFTSMVWNMTFSVYETLSSLPVDQREAMAAFQVRGRLRLERFYLPACIPRLVYNSILSWTNGWYFLIACEILAVGRETRVLPGLGSYLVRAQHAGSIPDMVMALAVLIGVIMAMNRWVWAPLEVWAERYKQEFAGARATLAGTAVSVGEELHHPVVRGGRAAPAVFEWLVRMVAAGMGPFLTLRERFRGGVARQLVERAPAFLTVLIGVGVALILFQSLAGFTISFPKELGDVPKAAGASFLRIAVGYLVAAAWTIPAAVHIARNPRAHRVLVPLFQVLAAIPATAFFPVIVHFTADRFGGMNLASVLLLLTGMQWYLFFNVLGGIAAIPADVLETAQAFGVRGGLFWKRILIPSIAPSFVTGSIAACGGGWNALVLSEYVRYRGTTYSTTGIGALLNHATYDQPNVVLLFAALLGMLVAIMLVNRFVWRPLYLLTTSKYKIDY